MFYGSSHVREGGSVSPFFSFLSCIVFRVSLWILVAWSLCLPRICALVPGCAPTSCLRGTVPCCVSSALLFSVLCRALPEVLSCSVVRLSYSRLLQRKCWITIEHCSKERSTASADHFLLPGIFCKDAASAP